MILGIGNDIIDIRRVEASLQKFGKRFEKRFFTEDEQKKCTSRKKAGAKIVAASYAKRFAAKEACAKALGTGLNEGISWLDIEISNIASGAPAIELSGAASKKLKSLTPPKMKPRIHVSLSDDYPFAQAYVVISAESL